MSSAQTRISDEKFKQIEFSYATAIPTHFGNTVQIKEWWEKVFLPVVDHELRLAPARLAAVKSTALQFQLFNDSDPTCRFLSPAFAVGDRVVVCPQVFNIYYGLMEAVVVASYVNEFGRQPAEFLDFASAYLYRELQVYVTSIAVGDRPRSVCNAMLLLHRFVENKSSEKCSESAVARPNASQSEFTSWWLAQVRRRDLPEERHITTLYGAVARPYFTFMIFTLLHEVAHLRLNHSAVRGSWLQDQELSADRYAFDSLVESGRDPAELLLLLISSRAMASGIRKFIAPGIGLPVGDAFPAAGAELREFLLDEDLRKRLQELYGPEVTRRLLSDLLDQLPKQRTR
jgi:hypothetical protein